MVMLYVILLPLLAHVAADDVEEQVMSQILKPSSGDSNRATNSLLPPPSLPSSLLLHLLRSTALQQPQHQHQDNNNNMNDNSNNSIRDSEDEDEEVKKRVFCNGFTGCGGRHRDRSRRQDRYGKRLIPLLVKRPFCNSHGCYNGKRAHSPGIPYINPEVAATYRTRLLGRLMASVGEARRELGELPVGARTGKRLFCNGYGGCRSGKRSLFSPWMSKISSVADGLR